MSSKEDGPNEWEHDESSKSKVADPLPLIKAVIFIGMFPFILFATIWLGIVIFQ